MVLTEGKVSVPTMREGGYTTLPTNLFSNWFNMNPVRELSQIKESMVELFTELFQGNQNGFGVTLQPATNVYLEEDQLIVEALVPGCSKTDLHINAMPHSLVISGEICRGEREMKNDQRYFWNEFGVGRRYYRHIQLPVEIKPEGIDAQYKNGILRLRLPVLETSYTKSVSVSIK
jgi:HSP20 family protein